MDSKDSDQSWMCAQWVAKDIRFPNADNKDSDQTGRMTRLCAQWVAKDPRFLNADNKDSDQTG